MKKWFLAASLISFLLLSGYFLKPKSINAPLNIEPQTHNTETANKQNLRQNSIETSKEDKSKTIPPFLSRNIKEDILEEPYPKIFNRQNYQNKANKMVQYALQLKQKYLAMEKTSGKVLQTHTQMPTGKSVVGIYENDVLVANLLYLPNNYLHELVEMKGEGIQDGLTISYSPQNGLPNKIMSWKNNKLNGPQFHFDYDGNLTSYCIAENHLAKDVYIEWTSDGKPLKRSRIIDKPIDIFIPG